MKIDMSDKDIFRINVGRHPVSIVGLMETISKLSERLKGGTDEEIGEAMAVELAKKNYIPTAARGEYRKAFAMEFRKALGLPYSQELPDGLEIKVLGSGCYQCESLVQLVMEILVELDIPANVEHLRDAREIANYRVLGVPALVINERVVWSGSIPLKDKLKSWIQEAVAGVGKD